MLERVGLVSPHVGLVRLLGAQVQEVVLRHQLFKLRLNKKGLLSFIKQSFGSALDPDPDLVRRLGRPTSIYVTQTLIRTGTCQPNSNKRGK